MDSFNGGYIPRAFSTALAATKECAVEHMPQTLSVKYTASVGVLPFSIFSKPLNIIPWLLASITTLFSISTSICRYPLILVTGLITTLVLILSPP